MIKIISFLLFLGIIAFTVTQASAECNIVWSGDLSGSVPTQETSRTQQAAYEAFMSIQPNPPTGFTDNCYYYSYYYKVDFPTMHYLVSEYDQVCINGTWSYDYYEESKRCVPDYCEEYRTGNWDVVCENNTTSTIPTTTTTTAPATVVTLASFNAKPYAREVVIEWETETEINNAGFNLYRSESENGNYIKINTSLIPAQGSSTQGTSYEFTDKDVQNRKTYYYKLEDIDLNGVSTFHGPVSATPRVIYDIR